MKKDVTKIMIHKIAYLTHPCSLKGCLEWYVLKCTKCKNYEFRDELQDLVNLLKFLTEDTENPQSTQRKSCDVGRETCDVYQSGLSLSFFMVGFRLFC